MVGSVKINLPQRPGPNADLKTLVTFVSRFSEVALKALTRNVSYTDNICGALITGPSSAGSAANTGLAMPHGVPVLVKNPLPQNAKPIGVQVLNCDTQCNPHLQISYSAIVNRVLTPAPSGYFYLTALYPVPITDWVSYTPTGSWTTNTTYTGKWRRVGDTVDVQAHLALAGAPNATSLVDIFLPTGLVIDASKILNTNVSFNTLGYAAMKAAGIGVYQGNVTYRSTTSVRPTAFGLAGTPATNSPVFDETITTTVPNTWASGDFLDIVTRLPIVGWGISSVSANVTLFVAGA